MDDTGERKKVVVKIGPPDKPYGKLIVTEKRTKTRDRRKVHTYIAEDRRSGIADRRKR
jgi:hypothetical protein